MAFSRRSRSRCCRSWSVPSCETCCLGTPCGAGAPCWGCAWGWWGWNPSGGYPGKPSRPPVPVPVPAPVPGGPSPVPGETSHPGTPAANPGNPCPPNATSLASRASASACPRARVSRSARALRGFLERFSLGTRAGIGEAGLGEAGLSFRARSRFGSFSFILPVAAGFAGAAAAPRGSRRVSPRARVAPAVSGSRRSGLSVLSDTLFSSPSAPLTSRSLAATPRSPSAAATRAQTVALCRRSAALASTRPQAPHAARPTPRGAASANASSASTGVGASAARMRRSSAEAASWNAARSSARRDGDTASAARNASQRRGELVASPRRVSSSRSRHSD